MSKPEFNNTGLVVQSFAEVFAEFQAGFEAIYGSDIDVEQDSPDGQRLGIYSKLSLDMQLFLLSLYNSFDPDLAEGVALDQILKIAGITRDPASQSTWALDVTTDLALTLPVGYTVSDELNQNWVIQTEVDLPIGLTSTTFFSELFGAIAGDIGSTITPVSIINGVTLIEAPVAATLGRPETTDARVREIRAQSLANPANGTRGRLNAKLLDLDDVPDAQVYENPTNAFIVEDPELGLVINLEPHSLWCVVDGGVDATIADVILKNKSGGVNLKGAIEVVVQTEQQRPGGSTFNVPSVMKFDRPLVVEVDIQVTVTLKEAGNTPNFELIKEKIAAVTFFIGQILEPSMLYEPAFTAGDNYFLSDLGARVLASGDPYTEVKLTPDAQEKFNIDTANINIIVVVP